MCVPSVLQRFHHAAKEHFAWFIDTDIECTENFWTRSKEEMTYCGPKPAQCAAKTLGITRFAISKISQFSRSGKQSCQSEKPMSQKQAHTLLFKKSCKFHLPRQTSLVYKTDRVLRTTPDQQAMSDPDAKLHDITRSWHEKRRVSRPRQ